MTRKAILLFLLLFGICVSGIERQSNADYRARRMAVANAMHVATLLLFAGTEAEGFNDLYGFRQDDNFYYLTGWSKPGAALLIAPASQDPTSTPNPRGYTEILFLPAHNLLQEK